MEISNPPRKYEMSKGDALAVSGCLSEMKLYTPRIKKGQGGGSSDVVRALGFNYIATHIEALFKAIHGNGKFVFSSETLGRYNIYVPVWSSQSDPRFITFSYNLRLNVNRKLEDFNLHRTQGGYEGFIRREEEEINKRYHGNLRDYSEWYSGDKVIALHSFRPIQVMRQEELLVLHGDFQAFASGVFSACEMYARLVDK